MPRRKQRLEDLDRVEPLPPRQRVNAATVSQLLHAVADGMVGACLARAWDPTSTNLLFADGWEVWLIRGGPCGWRVQQALGPRGEEWDLGCERDDWTRGPDSKLVEPVELLPAAVVRSLLLRLRYAQAMAPLDGAVACHNPLAGKREEEIAGAS